MMSIKQLEGMKGLSVFRNPAKLQGATEKDVFVRSDEEAFVDITDKCSALRLLGTESNEKVMLLKYQNIPMRLQNGPSCGLVALRVAGEHLLKDFQFLEKNGVDLLALAKEKGFSTQGEMFDSYWLATLGSIAFPQLRSVVRADMTPTNLLEGLLDNRLYLVPYDASPNHEPFVANGNKAHWALVVGFAITCEKDPNFPLIEKIAQLNLKKRTNEKSKNGGEGADEDDDDGSALADVILLDQDGRAEALKEAMLWHAASQLQDVYVIALQGKSKKVGVWSLMDLLQSNGSLTKVDTNDKGYIIPDTLDNLRGKFIEIQAQSPPS